MEPPEEPLEGEYEGVLRVVGLDGCVVVGLERCVVGRVVVLDVPERDVLVPVVGRVVVLDLFPTASLLDVAPRVRVPTREGLDDLFAGFLVTLPFSDRTRLVFPTAERVVVVRVPFAVARVVRPVTMRPFLSRATRVVLPTRVLYPLREATRVGALRGRTLYRFPP